jgi:integrase
MRHSQRKRNWKKRQFEPLLLDTVRRKINAIPDKRLMLAYRLMLAAGIRISEAAALRPEDIAVKDQSIRVNICSGKGGKSRTVTSLPDPYLAKELPKLIDDPLFYSASHMGNEAARYGFECHDLRRAFSQEYRRLCKSAAPDIYTANGQLMEAMGHDDYRTTKKYLRRRIQR